MPASLLAGAIVEAYHKIRFCSSRCRKRTMLGAIALQEFRPRLRFPRLQIYLRIYTFWLIIQALFYFGLYTLDVHLLAATGIVYPGAAVGAFVARFFTTLVEQHLFLVAVLTPAFTAGAI